MGTFLKISTFHITAKPSNLDDKYLYSVAALTLKIYYVATKSIVISRTEKTSNREAPLRSGQHFCCVLGNVTVVFFG
jgi:hypothetical protein